MAYAKHQQVMLECFDFITIDTLDDSATIRLVTDALASGEVFIFTSANAAKAVAANPAAHTHKPTGIFCIGQATRIAVEHQWSDATLLGTADNAEALAEKVAASGVKSAVFFCGISSLDILPKMLCEAGVSLQQIPVYKTIETPHSCKHDYAAVLCYSPSGVHSYFTANIPNANTVFFVIGETTANAIKVHTSNRVIVSSQPNKLTMLEQAITLLKNNDQLV